MNISAQPPRQPLDAAGQDATRRHLLDAAAEVFSEAGFQDATVREICQRAEANIAAVNYHFGDKETLYREVLKDCFRKSLEQYPADMGLAKGKGNTPEERLHAFVRSFLYRIFPEGPKARPGKLMAREMIQPTGALDEVVRQHIQPMAAILGAIVQSLLGPKADPATARRCSMSVVSQILFYHHCRPVVQRAFPEFKFDTAELEKLADHITRFSLAAMKEMAGGGRKRKAGRKQMK